MKSKIDYIKTISLIATFLLCAAIVSQTIYYLFFNISISEYLNPSEVLLLFTKDIFRFTIVAIVSISISMLLNHKKTNYKLRRLSIQYIQAKSFKDRLLIYFNRKAFYHLFILTLTIFAVISLLKKEKTAYIDAVFAVLLLVYSCVYFISWEYKRFLRINKELKKENENREIYFLLGFSFIFFITVWTIVDVRNVKYGQKYINVSFKISDRTVMSDSSKYYIGQTEKYLFYYNSKTDITTVFNRPDIEQIDFGKINYIKNNREKQ